MGDLNKNIVILGSTGSIGVNTLNVIDEIGGIDVIGLACGDNLDLIANQIKKYKPRLACVKTKENKDKLESIIDISKTTILFGIDGLIELATSNETELVVSSLVGAVGLLPTVAAIKAKKNIALANKETLVCAGELITNLAKENNIKLIPIDSEHSAILQSMLGHSVSEIKKIILTASGGPFFNKSLQDLKNVNVKEALKHPNWDMGARVTIDSSTMMNKGLEIIEAKWLFDIEPSQIDVLIHPQSIIHSMVEYIDGSVISQMAVPDMRIPISYALYYPNRKVLNLTPLRLEGTELTFIKPDLEKFKCLKLAKEAIKIGRSMPIVLNASNEVAREAFLEERIKFLAIPEIVEKTMAKHDVRSVNSVEEILDIDKWARKETTHFIK